MRRRRIPLWVLVLAFVLVPLAEIYVIIQVGQVIGAWWTILLLVADSLFGAWLVKREGRRAWAALREALRSGRMPSGELADGALILVGGTLMITPGFLTDIAGFFFVLPFTRPLARRWATGFVQRRLDAASLGAARFGGGPFGPTAPGPGYAPRPPAGGRGAGRGSPDVVRGDVVRPEDEPH